jgi:hypothetical protein
MKTTKELLNAIPLISNTNHLGQSKQNQREPNYENYKNDEPGAFTEEKQVSMETPYTREELIKILDKVEDYLLDARNIRVPVSRYDMLLRELLNFRYNRKMFSVAIVWLKKGKFPVSKTTLELSDFFPDKKSIEQFTEDLVSKEHHLRVINSLKVDFQIERKKLEIELFEKYANSEVLKYENEYKLLLIQSKDKELQYQMKIESLEKTIAHLQREVDHNNRRNARKSMQNIDETTDID